MALARRNDGSVPPLFSGHEADGAKAGSGRHRHVFLAVVDRDRDGFVDEVLVAAPWACDHTTKAERQERAEFERVAPSLATVRAGRLGVISLTPVHVPKAGDRLIGPGRLWESATPYQPTLHARRIAELTCAVEHDVVDECGPDVASRVPESKCSNVPQARTAEASRRGSGCNLSSRSRALSSSVATATRAAACSKRDRYRHRTIESMLGAPAKHWPWLNPRQRPQRGVPLQA